MLSRSLAIALALGLAADAAAAASDQSIPVRVRILRGSRTGPPGVDERLQDVAGQLGRLAYLRWEEVGQEVRDFRFGKPQEFKLPNGAVLQLTLADARKDTVTFLVKVSAGRTRSRLTISKDQRIVHQVTDEKNDEAYFATIRPWP